MNALKLSELDADGEGVADSERDDDPSGVSSDDREDDCEDVPVEENVAVALGLADWLRRSRGLCC